MISFEEFDPGELVSSEEREWTVARPNHRAFRMVRRRTLLALPCPHSITVVPSCLGCRTFSC